MFNELLKQTTDGRFTYDVNSLTEIHVDYAAMQVAILTYKTAKQLTPKTKQVYHSLHGMFGNLTVEQKFNQLLESYK